MEKLPKPQKVTSDKKTKKPKTKKVEVEETDMPEDTLMHRFVEEYGSSNED